MNIAEKERTLDIITSEIIIIRDNTARTIRQGIIDIGRRLEEAKEQVPQGGWLDYLENVLGFKPSTAQNYMRIAREFGDGQIALDGMSAIDLFGDLGYSQLVPLLGISEDARKELAENNDLASMSSREIKKLTDDYKKAKKAEEIANQMADDAKNLAEKAEKATEKAEKALEKEMVARQALEDRNAELSGKVEDLLRQLKEKPIEVQAEIVPDEEMLNRVKEQIREETAMQIKSANERADSLNIALEKAKNPVIHQVNFLFNELQESFTKLETAFLNLKDEETSDRFSEVIFNFLDEKLDIWRDISSIIEDSAYNNAYNKDYEETE